MSESRSEFEAWMDKPVDWHVDGVPIKRRATMHESIRSYAEFGFTAGFEAGRRAALESAAKVCESAIDRQEAKRTDDRIRAAIATKETDDELRALRHASSVGLHNGALERAAKEIRALSKAQEGEP